jgi:hypothetical protein
MKHKLSPAIVDKIICQVLFFIPFVLAYLDATQHIMTFVLLQPK